VSTAERLARVRDRSTMRLTHYGRRSGKPYDVVIWFAVDGERIYLSTLNRSRQWTRNVVARPDVGLTIDGERFTGRMTVLTAEDERRRAFASLVGKYWATWLFDRVSRLLGRDPVGADPAAGRSAFYRVDLVSRA
jgi:deazaflavin-dependent oxidoreductase (nitroreductase family)